MGGRVPVRFRRRRHVRLYFGADFTEPNMSLLDEELKARENLIEEQSLRASRPDEDGIITLRHEPSPAEQVAGDLFEGTMGPAVLKRRIQTLWIHQNRRTISHRPRLPSP